MASGHLEEALASFERSVQTSGGVPYVVGQLGNALARAGRRDEALRQLDLLRTRAASQYVPAMALAYVRASQMSETRPSRCCTRPQMLTIPGSCGGGAFPHWIRCGRICGSKLFGGASGCRRYEPRRTGAPRVDGLRRATVSGWDTAHPALLSAAVWSSCPSTILVSP